MMLVLLQQATSTEALSLEWSGLLLRLAAVMAVVCILRTVALGLSLRKRQFLDAESPSYIHRKKAPRLTVLVAARNEEDNIEQCVQSLLDQDYPNLEVIAINDRSTDETGRILGRMERAAGGRLRVIRVVDLPAGWFGKCNAMRLGVESATGEYLCFTDADCRQLTPQSLSIAMRRTLDEKIDFLTLTPVLEMNSFWERLTQPVCAWIFMVWFRPQVVNNPESTTAYANGAFMLMSRHCYESIDGFERVRGQLGEDVELARQAKSAGFRLRMLENRDLYQTRMYDTVKDSWRGWTRIFHGSLRSVPRLAASIAILSTVTLMPALLLAISLTGRLLAGPEQVAWWNNSLIAWGTVMALGHLTAVWFYRVVGLRGLWPLTYVAGTLITVAMLTDALLQQAGFRRTIWRGTSYQTTGTNAYRRAA